MECNNVEKSKFNKSKIINTLVVGLLLILCLNLITSKSDKLFQIIGFRSYTVLSGSMEPTYMPGDMIITKHKSKSNIEVGDVITFRDNEGVIITHRIIEQTKEGYITRGDNNNVDDADVLKEADVIGEVAFSIPKLGFASKFLSNPFMIAAQMIILAIFIFIYFKD